MNYILKKSSPKKAFSKRKTLGIVFLFFLLVFVWQYELIFYGLSQGIGQVKIIFNTKTIDEVYADPIFPDSLKTKIKLIQEIRQFAFDSLGINKNNNYTTIYDQKNKPILWVLTACEPYQLKAKEWTFPILGSFSYKGYFDFPKAKIEEQKLIKMGFDTAVDEVSGWSTLGWFKDPILSNMLKKSEGQLANLIIHELTHGTLYVKDNVEFNENLASFIGDKGAVKFLAFRFGNNSNQLKEYENRRIFSKEYTQLVLTYSSKFDSLYKKFLLVKDLNFKKQAKKEMFMKFEKQINDLKFSNGFSSKYYKEDSLNNTYIMDVKRYKQNFEVFEIEYKSKFNSDLKKYFNYLKSKYPSL